MQRPLIVQSDHTLLVEVDHPDYPELRGELARFAELVKSPEHVHTYRLTPLSLWNAAAGGLTAAHVGAVLERFSRYAVPDNVRAEIAEQISRYGRLRLTARGDGYALGADEPRWIDEIWNHRDVRPLLGERVDANTIALARGMRGPVKQALIRIGFPVDDRAGYVEGAPLPIAMRDCAPRDYQIDAAEIFHAGGASTGGSGVIVLPCGAGKTVVGMKVMELLSTHTLILATGTVAVRQWRRELLDKTTLTADQIGEYTGEAKAIRPVTLATYNILTHRRSADAEFTHFDLFDRMDWGLIVYDEVHLLPAPIFRATSQLQARRRLGLTATLVREDELETDVFSLIGPKKYDAPWKDLERQGWIAAARCTEIRVELEPSTLTRYAIEGERGKFRIAAENPAKLGLVRELVDRHASEPTLVIGQYVAQVEWISKFLGAPLIAGKTRVRERERIFDAFRRGEVPVLVLSRVGNFSIDLPEASVLIQVSGQFGSRQEEAQRLGRVLRPKRDGKPAHFYSLVSRHSVEEEFAANRQRFLTEQGYAYEIVADGAIYSGEFATLPKVSLS